MQPLNDLSSGEEVLNRRTTWQARLNSGEAVFVGVEPSKTDPISDERSLTGGKTKILVPTSGQPRFSDPPQTHERR